MIRDRGENLGWGPGLGTWAGNLGWEPELGTWAGDLGEDLGENLC